MKPPPFKLGMQFSCPAVLVGRLHCYKASRFYLFSLSLAGTRSMSTLLHSSRPLLKHLPAPRFEKNWNLKTCPTQASKRCRNMNSRWLQSPCLISLIAPARAHATLICAKNFTFMSSSCKGLSKGAKCRLESRTLRTFLPMKVLAITLGTCIAFPSAEKAIKKNINKSKVDSHMR